MKQKLEEINSDLGYLIEQLRSHHLLDKINLIVTSDHGMEDISKEKSIFLDLFIDLNLFEIFVSNLV